MFKSKSFDLNNEENSKQTEHLYQPRRIRWMKYILFPVAIGFVTVLIVCNIDFSTEPEPPKKKLISHFLQSAEWCRINCSLQESNRCDKNVSNLNIGYTNFSYISDCTANYLLRLENYKFPDGIINNDTFAIEYKLQSLVISNCTLSNIEDGAFDQNSLHNLLTLELINTQLSSINQYAFRGLNQLRNFTLINKCKSLKFKAFIALLKNTLYSATIHQQYSANSIYKLSDFFGFVIYKQLKILNLSGNNFGATLKAESFRIFPVLQYLFLANCGLNSIDFNLKNGNFNTLRYLDLSGNMLKRLSTQFIYSCMKKSICINIAGNLWNYSYTSSEYLKFPESDPNLLITLQIDEIEDTASNEDTSTNEDTTTTNTTIITTTTYYHTPAIRTTPSTATVPIINNTTPILTTLITDTTNITDITETTPSITDENSILCVQLICFNVAKETISNKSISYNVFMKIENSLENEVYVTLSQLDDMFWNLIYFVNPTLVSHVEKEVTDDIVTGDIMVTVKDLSCDTSYVFCLLIEDNVTSPFNCQSHHTMACDMKKQGWFEAHILLIVCVAIVGILICVTLGVFAMYGILWLRPTWLCGSKRLVRPSRESLTMVLMPSSYEKEVYGVIRNQNSENTIGEYVTYYRHLEQAKLSLAESNKYNIPPQESAPTVPPSGEQIRSSNSNAYTYECFELYEELI